MAFTKKILGNKISIHLVITRLDKSRKVDKLEGASMHLHYVMEKNNNLPSSCPECTVESEKETFFEEHLSRKHQFLFVYFDEYECGIYFN